MMIIYKNCNFLKYIVYIYCRGKTFRFVKTLERVHICKIGKHSKQKIYD